MFALILPSKVHIRIARKEKCFCAPFQYYVDIYGYKRDSMMKKQEAKYEYKTQRRHANKRQRNENKERMIENDI